MNNLSTELDSILAKNGKSFFAKISSPIIENNLNQKFKLREYQREAFGRFIHYYENRNNDSMHLLFHMATGSGKTLIMAGLIIYLYSKGYKNFLFLVNSTNIIEKTKDNFLYQNSLKYLFNNNINIDNKKIKINKVDNFQSTQENAINIAFETVQGLYSDINSPRENSLTINDFIDKKIVFIADEAHHINVETKNIRHNSADLNLQTNNWESTIMSIFKSNKHNILLEFTATANLDNQLIANKYNDKLIYDYPLRQFCADGYSKNVQILQSDTSLFYRALQAVLLNIYRSKLLEKYNIKPIILFKSHTIKESKSFQQQFTQNINKLTINDIEEIQKLSKNTILGKFFDYCSRNNITNENLIIEIKIDFGPDKLLSINSQDDSEDKTQAINTLEYSNNPYRAVFAVDKLNEGWDVLNLFDIVNVFDTKPDTLLKTTTQEAQLIGRGARYCPFGHDNNAYQRKFDNDNNNEMRICEQLYYHSSYFPKYIKELNSELKKIGLCPINTHRTTTKSICTNRKPLQLSDIFNDTYKIDINSTLIFEQNIFENTNSEITSNSYTTLKITDFEKKIIYKAINRTKFYQFDTIKQYIPDLESIDEFIFSNKYLSNIKILTHNNTLQLTPQRQLQIIENILNKLEHKLKYNVQ